MVAILVVEDEPMVALEVSETLRDKGYCVITVTNADDSIEVLEARNDIHTIFTDINMPGSMDGLKLAATVRDRWPPVNIIVTTGRQPAAPPPATSKKLVYCQTVSQRGSVNGGAVIWRTLLKKVRDYLRHAAECRELAGTATSAHRQQLEEMATT